MTQTKKFKKKIEDFNCENCGQFVIGSGFTNHCPNCLWSKHVDIFPGDRKASCHGMMEPIGLEINSGEYILIHKCTTCGHLKKNKTSQMDDFNQILQLSQKIARIHLKGK